jgi:hypothetical protein
VDFFSSSDDEEEPRPAATVSLAWVGAKSSRWVTLRVLAG